MVVTKKSPADPDPFTGEGPPVCFPRFLHPPHPDKIGVRTMVKERVIIVGIGSVLTATPLRRVYRPSFFVLEVQLALAKQLWQSICEKYSQGILLSTKTCVWVVSSPVEGSSDFYSLFRTLLRSVSLPAFQARIVRTLNSTAESTRPGAPGLWGPRLGFTCRVHTVGPDDFLLEQSPGL